MAGSDEQLRMIATLTDQWSPQLKQMQRSLRSLAAETGDFHKKGVIASKGHTESLLQLRREVGNVSERVKSGLSPSLAALGISGLSAAAGIAAVTKSLVDFAVNARHLEFMARQTQFTVNQLRMWEQEASRLETTAESLTGGFVTFNEQMEKMRRGGPFIGVRREIEQLRSTLGVWGSGALEGLVKSLQGLPREAQLEKILKFADRIDNISQRRKLLSAFGLDPALANKQSAEVLKDLDAIHKALGDLTPQQLKAGTEFQEAIESIKTSLTGMRDAIGADLAPAMKGVAESIAEFGKVHAGDVADALKAFVDRMRELGNSELVSNLRAFASGVDRVVEATTGWAPLLATLAAYKFAQFLGVAAGIRSIATALGLLSSVASPPACLGLLGMAGAAAADKDRQKRGPAGAGGLYGTPLLGFDPVTGAPIEMPQGKEQRGDAGPTGGIGNLPAGADKKPLWRRLFDSINQEGGLLHKTGFNVEGGGPNPLLGGAGADRGLEGIIERGTLAALRDFAAEQKGAEGGGGGGGGGSGIGAIRAAYSPSGTGGGGLGAGTGEPAGGGGAGTGGGPASNPMGALGASPAYPTTLDQAGGAGAPGRGDPRGMLAAVRQAAIKHGINPDLMERVARGEGLGARYSGGDGGTSFGAMQLHRGGAGSVGTEFERQTGLNLADPRNERAAIDYAAQHIAKHGWGAWSAARIRGITGKMGVGIDTSRWSGELNRKPPHFGVQDIRDRLQGAGLAAPVGTGSADVTSALRQGSAASGIDLPHLKAMASIESGFSASSNMNRSTQYKGLFQIGRSEWAEYLRHGGSGSIYNARDNAMAMSYLVKRNSADFKSHFGRDPTPGEVYMMHQQGLGFYTRGAMTNIAGNPYPGMHGPQSHASFEAG